MATPSQILCKTKKSDEKEPSTKVRTDKQGDDEHDEKMPVKGTKRNALIDFIAKSKKSSKE